MYRYRLNRSGLKLCFGVLIIFLTATTIVVSSFSVLYPGSVTCSGYVNIDFESQDSGRNAGFKVEIMESGKSILTDSNGYFEIKGISRASAQPWYTAKISKTGFLERIIPNIPLNGNAFLGSLSTPVDIWAGDINQDSAINMTDIVEMAKSFNSTSGSAQYSQVNDFNKDNAVNMTDIMIAVKHFNKTVSDYSTAFISLQTLTPFPTITIPTSTPLPVENLVSNGDFSSGFTNWTFWTESGASASNTVINGEDKTSVSNSGPNPWSVHIYQGPFGLISGKVYELSFNARSTISRNIQVNIENSSDYTKYFYDTAAVNGTMNGYTFRFTAGTSDNSARMVFIMGSIDGLITQSHDIYLDNIVLKELNDVTVTPTPTKTPLPSDSGWKLVWSDEFNGTNGSKPDSAKWVYDLGGGGWGNNELEYYTDNVKNSYQENGHLVIKAIKETVEGYNYTSARLKTKGKFEQTYGRFEARIKIPYGQGMWPAFWMLGNDIDSVSWPGCGEIDIMENIGKEPNIIHGTMHGPGYSADKGLTASYTGPRFSDDYHTFSVEWDPNVIRWYCDGKLYETRTTNDIGSNKWVYSHPFFMLLNVAVGGGWPGNPDSSTVFPQVMEVDYVRVYQR